MRKMVRIAGFVVYCNYLKKKKEKKKRKEKRSGVATTCCLSVYLLPTHPLWTTTTKHQF